MRFPGKILSAFFISLLTAAAFTGLSLSEDDVEEASEITCIDDSPDQIIDKFFSTAVYEYSKGAGDGDDNGEPYAITIIPPAAMHQAFPVVACSDLKALLLGRYMLELMNEIQTPCLYILYSCPKIPMTGLV